MNDRPALLDTSVLSARQTGRPIDDEAVLNSLAVSVVTLAGLHLGVLAARDTETRARRLVTLERVAAQEPLPVDVDVARRWAGLRTRLADEGKRAKVNDLWIAATASANGLDVVTQDDAFDVIESVGGPAVIRV